MIRTLPDDRSAGSIALAAGIGLIVDGAATKLERDLPRRVHRRWLRSAAASLSAGVCSSCHPA
jgi:hypothetical protein